MTQTTSVLADWPARGYNGPQPWDADALGVPRHVQDDILKTRARNTVTPTISHSFKILTSGSVDNEVHELGRKLGDLGFPNSVSEGTNPFGHVDQTVMSAIKQFRRAYGVTPDLSGFGDDEALANNHIDPWTVEALLRAHEKEIR